MKKQLLNQLRQSNMEVSSEMIEVEVPSEVAKNEAVFLAEAGVEASSQPTTTTTNTNQQLPTPIEVEPSNNSSKNSTKTAENRKSTKTL